MIGRESFSSFVSHNTGLFTDSFTDGTEAGQTLDVLILHDDSPNALASCRILALELIQRNIYNIWLSSDLENDLELVFDDNKSESGRKGTGQTGLTLFELNEDSLSYAITEAQYCLFFLTDYVLQNQEVLKLFGMVRALKSGDPGSLIYVHETEDGFGGIQRPLSSFFSKVPGISLNRVNSVSDYSEATSVSSAVTQDFQPSYNIGSDDEYSVIRGFTKKAIPFNRREPFRSYALGCIMYELGAMIYDMFFPHLIPAMKHFVSTVLATGSMGTIIVKTISREERKVESSTLIPRKVGSSSTPPSRYGNRRQESLKSLNSQYQGPNYRTSELANGRKHSSNTPSRKGSKNRNLSAIKRTGSRSALSKQSSLGRNKNKKKIAEKNAQTNQSSLPRNKSLQNSLGRRKKKLSTAHAKRISTNRMMRISAHRNDLQNDVGRRNELVNDKNSPYVSTTQISSAELFGEPSRSWVVDKMTSWLKKGVSNVKMRNGEQVLILSGPMGSGKTTLVSHLASRVLQFSPPEELLQGIGALSPYQLNGFSAPMYAPEFASNALGIHYFNKNYPASLSVHACFSSILFQLCDIIPEVAEEVEEFYNYYDMKNNLELIGTPESIFKTICELLDKSSVFERLKLMKQLNGEHTRRNSTLSLSSSTNGDINGLCIFVIDGIESLPKDEMNSLLFIVGTWWSRIMPPWVRLVLSMRPETLDSFMQYKNVVTDNFTMTISIDSMGTQTGNGIAKSPGSRYKKTTSNPSLFYGDLQNVLEMASMKVRSKNDTVNEKLIKTWNAAYNNEGLIFVRILIDLLRYAEKAGKIREKLTQAKPQQDSDVNIVPLNEPIEVDSTLPLETVVKTCEEVMDAIMTGINKSSNLKDLLHIWCEVLHLELDLSSNRYRHNYRYRETLGALLVSRGPLPLSALEWINTGSDFTANILDAIMVLFRVVDSQGGKPMLICMHSLVKDILIDMNARHLPFGHLTLSDWCVHICLREPYSTLDEDSFSFMEIQRLNAESRYSSANFVYHMCKCNRMDEIAIALTHIQWLSVAMTWYPKNLLYDLGHHVLGINKTGQESRESGQKPMVKRLKYVQFDSMGNKISPKLNPFCDFSWLFKEMFQVLKSSEGILSFDPRELASQLLLRLQADRVNPSSSKNLITSDMKAISKLKKLLLQQAEGFNPMTAQWHPVYPSYPLSLGTEDNSLWEINVTARVNKVVVSADSKTILIASANQDVFELSADRWVEGYAMRTLQAHEDEVLSVVLPPNAGANVFISYSEQRIYKWDGTTGEPLVLDESIVGDMVQCMHYSPDGSEIACLCSDRIRFFDAVEVDLQKSLIFEGFAICMLYDNIRCKDIWIGFTNGRIGLLGSDDKVSTVTTLGSSTIRALLLYIHDKRRILAAATDDNIVHLWDTTSKKEVAVLRGHSDHVLDIADASAIDSLVTCGWDRSIRVWDKRTHLATHVFTGHEDAVTTIACISCPDHTRIISGSLDGTVKMWLVEKASSATTNGKHNVQEPTLEQHSDTITCVAVRPDSRVLATCSFDNCVYLRDVDTGYMICKLGHQKQSQVNKQPIFANHKSPVYCVVFSPNNRFVATGDEDGNVAIWCANKGRVLFSYKHEKGVLCVAFSHDSQCLASGSADKTAQLWSVSNDMNTATVFQKISDLSNPNGPVFCVAFSPLSQGLIATSTKEMLVPVKIWELPEVYTDFVDCPAAVINASHLENSSVKVIIFSGCGNYLIVAAELGKQTNQQHAFFVFKVEALSDRDSLQSQGSVLHSTDSTPTVRLQKFQIIYSRREADLLYVGMTLDCKVLVEVTAEKKSKCWDIKTSRILEESAFDLYEAQLPIHYHSALHAVLQAFPMSRFDHNHVPGPEEYAVGFTSRTHRAQGSTVKSKSRNTAMMTFDKQSCFVKDDHRLHILRLVEYL